MLIAGFCVAGRGGRVQGVYIMLCSEFDLMKIVGVQSRNKCSLWNVERKEWAGPPHRPHRPHPPHPPHPLHTPHPHTPHNPHTSYTPHTPHTTHTPNTPNTPHTPHTPHTPTHPHPHTPQIFVAIWHMPTW
jgi:hypothetical protein